MTLDDALAILAEQPTARLDLAMVALLIAADEYSDLDVTVYLARLDDLADDIRPHLTGTWDTDLAIFTGMLFDSEGFTGNGSDYYDPRNSYLNDVLDRKLGIPITLAILAIAVGERLGFDVQGVGLPGHFVAQVLHPIDAEPTLFDPFHQGRILDRNDCETLVHAITGMSVPLTREMLAPLPIALIVLRMLTNLKAIFLQQNDLIRAHRTIARMRQLMPDDPLHRRDLGVVLLQMGQPGRAIDELVRYLEMSPNSSDRNMVEEAIRQARGEIAKWN